MNEQVIIFASTQFLIEHVILTTRSDFHLHRKTRRNSNKTHLITNLILHHSLNYHFILFLSSLRLSSHMHLIPMKGKFWFSLGSQFSKKVKIIVNFNLWSPTIKYYSNLDPYSYLKLLCGKGTLCWFQKQKNIRGKKASGHCTRCLIILFMLPGTKSQSYQTQFTIFES